MEPTWTGVVTALMLLGACLVAMRVLRAVKTQAQATNHHDAGKASSHAREKTNHQRPRVRRSRPSGRAKAVKKVAR